VTGTGYGTGAGICSSIFRSSALAWPGGGSTRGPIGHEWARPATSRTRPVQRQQNRTRCWHQKNQS
jgi:hypothetical protein